MITKQQLQELMRYDPLTGVFTWINASKKGGFIAGRIANCLDVHGYGQINIMGKVYKSHRLAWLYMTGGFPDGQIDHINHNRSDNRWMNLRCVDNVINHKNRPKQSNNTSGFVGVSQCSKTGFWVAFIHSGGKRIHLGRFKNIDDAISARKKANEDYGFHSNHGKTQGRPKYYKSKLKSLENSVIK